MACVTGRAAVHLLVLLLLNCCWLPVLSQDADSIPNNKTTTLSPDEDGYVYLVPSKEVDIGMIMSGIVITVFILSVTACVIAGCVIAYLFFRKKRPSASATFTGSSQSAAKPAYDV